MTGTSSKPSSFQRADGWCESAGMTCESILERNAEHVQLVSISGENRYIFSSGRHMSSTRVATREYSRPFLLGREFFIY